MTAHYRGAASRGTLAADEAEARIARIAGTTDLGAVADADIVIEAVFEDMAIKSQVFAALDRIAKPGAVLATNTSYLDVDAIARGTSRAERIVGMHFFSPAHIMRLLEVVRGAATSAQTLATAIAVGRKIGKIPVVVGVCHGFVGNRMHRVRGTEGERLLLDGALPQDVDCGDDRVRLSHGPLRGGRSRRPRHRLAHAQGARICARRSRTCCASRAASARRPGAASIAMRRARARESRTPRSRR